MATRTQRLRRDNMVLNTLKKENRVLKKTNEDLVEELARTRKALRRYTKVIEIARGALAEHSKE